MAPGDTDTPDTPENDDDDGDDDDEDDEDGGTAPRGAQPGPAPAQSRGEERSGSGGGSVEGESHSSAARPRVLENAANVSSGTDTGMFPQGGIQAGGGGMADDGDALPALLLGSGAIALVLTAGGLRLRRRGLGS